MYPLKKVEGRDVDLFTKSCVRSGEETNKHDGFGQNQLQQAKHPMIGSQLLPNTDSTHLLLNETMFFQSRLVGGCKSRTKSISP